MSNPQAQEPIPVLDLHLRGEACAFLQEAGIKLKLPQLTIATAIVFFHRFFARNSYLKYDRFSIATTCLFLAGKVEETPKKLQDVLVVTHQLRHSEPLRPDSREYWELRENVLSQERVLLECIGFELTVEHPYKYLLKIVKDVSGSKNIAQVAWNFVNDSLRTTLCLYFQPQLIAIAAIYLASRFLKCPLSATEGKQWWEDLNAKIQDLEEISNQILDLYESSKEDASGTIDKSKRETDTIGMKLDQANDTLKQREMSGLQNSDLVKMKHGSKSSTQSEIKSEGSPSGSRKHSQMVNGAPAQARYHPYRPSHHSGVGNRHPGGSTEAQKAKETIQMPSEPSSLLQEKQKIAEPATVSHQGEK